MAVLNVFKLGFKVDNGCGLMVEGGGVLHRRRGAWHLGCSGADREATRLGLAARPEEDEGGRAPMVRERREGHWAGGRVAWAGRRPRPGGGCGRAG
jgi:hypothetical protein